MRFMSRIHRRRCRRCWQRLVRMAGAWRDWCPTTAKLTKWRIWIGLIWKWPSPAGARVVVVPRLFPNSTIVCLASGPSLTAEDVDYCRGRAPVIAVNDTYRLAPWANVLYACDAKWWDARQGVPAFAGLKFALRHGAAKWPGVQVLRDSGDCGLATDPSELTNGKSSGHGGVNLASHLGAKRIVLLGYDMQYAKNGRTHFFGDHVGVLNKGEAPFEWWIANFASMVQPAKALGIEIVNCTRRTALTCFRQMSLADAL